MSFEDGVRERAENARLDLELRLNESGIEHEVVLLEAPTENAMRRTHRRYFETLEAFRNTWSSGNLVRERPPEGEPAD